MTTDSQVSQFVCKIMNMNVIFLLDPIRCTMNRIKVEEPSKNIANWAPWVCVKIENTDEDIKIEYVPPNETHYEEPQQCRTVIVPKSELGIEYDYIKKTAITIEESSEGLSSTINETICAICKLFGVNTTLCEPSRRLAEKQRQSSVCNKCSTKFLPKVVQNCKSSLQTLERRLEALQSQHPSHEHI